MLIEYYKYYKTTKKHNKDEFLYSPSVRVYDNNSVKVEKMCIRRAVISATPLAPDDTSFEEDTASVTHTQTRLSSGTSASLFLPTRAWLSYANLGRYLWQQLLEN